LTDHDESVRKKEPARPTGKKMPLGAPDAADAGQAVLMVPFLPGAISAGRATAKFQRAGAQGSRKHNDSNTFYWECK
jgi:hypothetical protein